MADKGKTIIKIQFRGVHIKKRKKIRSVSSLWLTASEAERCSLNFRAAIGWISALSRKLVAERQHIMFCGTRAGGDGSPPRLSAEQRQELWELRAAKREKAYRWSRKGMRVVGSVTKRGKWISFDSVENIHSCVHVRVVLLRGRRSAMTSARNHPKVLYGCVPVNRRQAAGSNRGILPSSGKFLFRHQVPPRSEANK